MNAPRPIERVRSGRALVLSLLWFAGGLAASPAAAQSFNSARVLKVRAVTSVDRAHPGTSFQIAVIADVDPEFHINAHVPSFDYLIPTLVKLDPADGLTYREPIYPAAVERAFKFSDGKPLKVYEGEVLVGVDVAVAAGHAPGPLTLKGVFSAQACNQDSCLAPGKVPFEVPVAIAAPGESVNVINTEIFRRIAGAAAPAGSPGDPPPNQIAAAVSERGLLFALALIFVGGLALNLTPCVYPLIPITVSYFGGQAAGRTSRSFGLACVYVLGMSVTYSALGTVAASTGGLLGSALQSPWVLGFVALVLVALALSMFGLFEIQLPSFLTSRVRAQQGPLGALFMGLTVGFVAAPCIGPFVVGLLAYVGQRGDPLLGFTMFFVLSLGLGLPFLILGTFSGAAATIPRAGAWMVWVRNLFGCILVGMALYFLRPLLPETAARIALGAIIIASGVFLGFLERSDVRTSLFRQVRYATALVAVVAGAWVLAPGKGNVEAVGWQAYEEALLARAASEGRPAIIDFSAEWCIACKELEHQTFTDAAVRAEADRFVTMRADMTSFASPPIEAIKQRFGILGLPWVVFLDAQGRERSDLRVTGYVPPEEFLARMKKVTP